jgi:hypothetical protein
MHKTTLLKVITELTVPIINPFYLNNLPEGKLTVNFATMAAGAPPRVNPSITAVSGAADTAVGGPVGGPVDGQVDDKPGRTAHRSIIAMMFATI